MSTPNATVRWFDALRGEGLVRLNDSQESVYVHFTAIEGIDKNGYGWPNEQDQEKLFDIGGKPCYVEVIRDSHYTQVSRLVLKEEN